MDILLRFLDGNDINKDVCLINDNIKAIILVRILTSFFQILLFPINVDAPCPKNTKERGENEKTGTREERKTTNKDKKRIGVETFCSCFNFLKEMILWRKYEKESALDN